MKPSIGGETEPSEMAAAAGRSAHRPQQLHFKSNNQVKKVGRSWRTFYQLLFRQIFSGVCVLLINFRNEMRRHLPGGPGQRLRHRRLGRCRLRRPRERERGRKRAEDDRCACFFLHWLIVGDSFVFLSCFFVSLISSDQYFDWFIPFSLSFSWWNIGGRSTGDFNSISFQSHRIFCPFLFLMLTARIIRPESVRVSAQSHLPADGISTTHPTPLQLKLRIRSIQSPSGAGGGGEERILCQRSRFRCKPISAAMRPPASTPLQVSSRLPKPKGTQQRHWKKIIKYGKIRREWPEIFFCKAAAIISVQTGDSINGTSAIAYRSNSIRMCRYPERRQSSVNGTNQYNKYDWNNKKKRKEINSIAESESLSLFFAQCYVSLLLLLLLLLLPTPRSTERWNDRHEKRPGETEIIITITVIPSISGQKQKKPKWVIVPPSSNPNAKQNTKRETISGESRTWFNTCFVLFSLPALFCCLLPITTTTTKKNKSN